MNTLVQREMGMTFPGYELAVFLVSGASGVQAASNLPHGLHHEEPRW